MERDCNFKVSIIKHYGDRRRFVRNYEFADIPSPPSINKVFRTQCKLGLNVGLDVPRIITTAVPEASVSINDDGVEVHVSRKKDLEDVLLALEKVSRVQCDTPFCYNTGYICKYKKTIAEYVSSTDIYNALECVYNSFCIENGADDIYFRNVYCAERHWVQNCKYINFTDTTATTNLILKYNLQFNQIFMYSSLIPDFSEDQLFEIVNHKEFTRETDYQLNTFLLNNYFAVQHSILALFENYGSKINNKILDALISHDNFASCIKLTFDEGVRNRLSKLINDNPVLQLLLEFL